MEIISGQFGFVNTALGLESLAGLATGQGVLASPGCFNSGHNNTVGRTFAASLNVATPNGLSAIREWVQFIPSSYRHGTPAPLIFDYHGQYGSAGIGSGFTSNLNETGWIMVAPQGMGDGNCGTGWNTGFPRGWDKNTCNSEANSWSCCYESCRQIGGVCTGDGAGANCGWTTCHSDTAFTASMLTKIGNELCIDLNAVFGTGASNGGMMSYALASDMPSTFRAVAPIVGLPLITHTDVPSTLGSDFSIFHLHGTRDTLIPPGGGNGDGWFYESPDNALMAYSSKANVGTSTRPFPTPFDGGSQKFTCTNYGSSDGRFVKCLYNAGHTTPQSYEDMLFWYFNRVLASSE